MADVFAPWLDRWSLTREGPEIRSHAGHLLPVRRGDEALMLKVSAEADEREAWRLLEWWDGDGAVRLLAHEGDAILMQRATGSRALADMARADRDNEVTAILCAALTALHRPRGAPPPAGLVPLEENFAQLWPAARTFGGSLAAAATTARRLLNDQQEVRPLHGDLHHDNVLDFGSQGWLAIDPKRLIGDRAFDYANIFTNPDLSDPTRPVATRPGVFERRLEIVQALSGLKRERLLDWIVAWTALSAAWYLGDDDPVAGIDLAILDKALKARG
ncbi:aminoglycoside phosphotransferase family protein [Brevundimonas sp. NPDC092305]|uniref:aminoglycoside phosphotransferase family protein n=1 Tax=Brevundimonas sp. NPDC092305 TaxID=3363957 RepID=UPI003813164E